MTTLSSPHSRMVLRFTEEADAWQRGHAEAMAVCDLEDWLGIGLSMFHAIQDAERRAYAHAASEQLDAIDQQFAETFSAWLLPSESFLTAIDQWARQGFQIELAAKFREAVDQARPYAASLQPTALGTRLSNAELLTLADTHRPAEEWLNERDESL